MTPTEIGWLIMVWTVVPLSLRFLLFRLRVFRNMVSKQRLSLTIRPGYVRAETTLLNDRIYEVFKVESRFSLPTMDSSSKSHNTNYNNNNLFYDVGVFVAAVCSIAGVIILTWNLLDAATRFATSPITPSTPTPSENIIEPNIMIPLIPGVTMPMTMTYILPLIVSILLTAGFHEIGHAIASAREGVKIQSIGMFMAAPVLCGAYVRLPLDIQTLAPRKQLRVWSAGIWHNILLCVLLSLLLSTPFMWLFHFISSPFYSTGQGAVMLETSFNSPLHGHVETSDVFVGLGGHSVRSVNDWYDSILEVTSSSSPSGFCVKEEWILSGESNCCEEEYDSATIDMMMCFRVDQSFIKDIHNSSSSSLSSVTCGSVSSLSSISNKLCTTTRECRSEKDDEHCVIPENIIENERVVWIDIRRNKDVSRSVFVGDLRGLWSGIVLSDHEFRFGTFFSFFTLFPICVDRTLNLALSISATLAVLNAIPMYYLDGQHIFDSALMILLRRRKRGYYTTLIYKWVMRSGTFLLVSNVLLSFLSFLHRYAISSSTDGLES
jgi:S2P endopeptidase